MVFPPLDLFLANYLSIYMCLLSIIVGFNGIMLIYFRVETWKFFYDAVFC